MVFSLRIPQAIQVERVAHLGIKIAEKGEIVKKKRAKKEKKTGVRPGRDLIDAVH